MQRQERCAFGSPTGEEFQRTYRIVAAAKGAGPPVIKGNFNEPARSYPHQLRVPPTSICLNEKARRVGGARRALSQQVGGACFGR